MLEVPGKPADGSVELEIMNTPVERKNPPKCGFCPDNERKKCKDSILLCDECHDGFHLKCVGLEDVPEADDWYCSD